MLRYTAFVALLIAGVRSQVQITVPASGAVHFQSKNYPNNYPDSHQESWTVTGPAGSSLQFDAVSFNLENSCSFDYLEIVDNGQSLGKFCGTDGPAGARSISNEVTINFKTDSSINRSGFNVSVRVAKCKYGEGFCPGNEDVCLPSSGWCNGVNDCPDGADEQCPDLNDCGKSTIKPALDFRGHKIVGGVEVVPHSWPWQVALLTTSNFQFCGGSIIAPKWIMTAAHCCAGKTASSVRVRVGAHSLSSTTEGAVTMDVDQVINHKSYTSSPATNWDFCLLKTKNPIQYNRQVAPVCLPSPSDALEVADTQCYITGWGTTSSGGSSASKLLQTSVKISNQQTCNTAYGGVIRDQMICAAEPGHDTCQGDSGGPLVCKDKATDSYKLIGVTSWGRGCALPGYPGVYGRTSVALDWILPYIVQN